MVNWHIRKAVASDIKGIARVQVDSYQTSYKNLVPDEFLSNFTYDEQQSDWISWFSDNPEDFMLVALDNNNEVVGYALNRVIDASNNIGEVVALHILPPLKKKGIGKQLFVQSVSYLKARGCKTVVLWTMINNPSRGFYDHLKGILVEEKDWIIDELNFQTKEVCYRWENLEVLLAERHDNDA